MVDSTAIRSTAARERTDLLVSRGRILVADPRRLYREAMARLIASTPVIDRVVSVGSFAEAVDACRAQPLDAALVHIQTLPGRRFEAAAELIDARPELRVAIVTEDGDLLDDAGSNGHAVVSSTDPLERLVAFVRAMAATPQDDLIDAWRAGD